MRRTYSAIYKRVSVNLNQEGADRLDEIYDRLLAHYNIEDKPSLSLMMAVALKRLVESDESSIDGLWAELQEEAKTKQPRAVPSDRRKQPA